MMLTPQKGSPGDRGGLDGATAIWFGGRSQGAKTIPALFWNVNHYDTKTKSPEPVPAFAGVSVDGMEKCGGDTLAKKSLAWGITPIRLELVPISSSQAPAIGRQDRCPLTGGRFNGYRDEDSGIPRLRHQPVRRARQQGPRGNARERSCYAYVPWASRYPFNRLQSGQKQSPALVALSIRHLGSHRVGANVGRF